MSIFNFGANKPNWLNRLKKSNRNLHTIIISIALLLYIRGVFGLIDLYIFPNTPLASYSISIIIALIILLWNDRKLEEIEKSQ